MRLSKRDRISLILLMGGVIALAVDRLLLPPPKAAQAASDAESDSSATAPAPPDLETLPPLAEVADPGAPPLGPVSDVFDLSRLPLPGARNADAAAGQPGELTVEAFVRRYTLQATIFGPNPVALVGQRTLHVGDVLDGFVLESIRDREAEFLSESGRAVLRVAPSKKRP